MSDRPKRKAKTIAELIEEIKADLVPSMPRPPADAEPPPKPRTEAAEREPGEEG